MNKEWKGKCFVWSGRETKIGCLLSATTHWTYTKSLVRWMRYFIVWYSSYITWQTCVNGYFLAINKTQFKTHTIWITFFTLNITVVYKTRMCQCVTSLFQCVSVCYWLWWRKQHRCVCVLLPPSDTTSQKHLCSLSNIILQHLLPCVFPPILYSFPHLNTDESETREQISMKLGENEDLFKPRKFIFIIFALNPARRT